MLLTDRDQDGDIDADVVEQAGRCHGRDRLTYVGASIAAAPTVPPVLERLCDVALYRMSSMAAP
ncbi:hypothetical protein [Ectopseudomonas oleovorans]|uniref:hypothetical protein n=1 Tax=Ectopseudomonas oleovorans TaxID=301 RepID=UPI003F1B8270